MVEAGTSAFDDGIAVAEFRDATGGRSDSHQAVLHFFKRYGLRRGGTVMKSGAEYCIPVRMRWMMLQINLSPLPLKPAPTPATG